MPASAESRRVLAERRRQRRLSGDGHAERWRGRLRVARRHAARSCASASATKSSRASGVSYQLREGKGDKAYANWGRYYNMDQKSSGRSLAPNRIFQTQTIFDLIGQRPVERPARLHDRQVDRSGARADLHRRDRWSATRRRSAGGTASTCSSCRATMHNFIEDVPSRLNGTAPDSGPFVAANLPCVAFAACQSADARRTYRALTVDVRRQLAQRRG